MDYIHKLSDQIYEMINLAKAIPQRVHVGRIGSRKSTRKKPQGVIPYSSKFQ